MIKKNKILMLLVLTLGLLLMGCGKKSNEAASSDATTASPTVATEKTGTTGETGTADTEASVETSIAPEDLQPFKIGLASQLDVPTGILGLAVQNGYLDEELAAVGYKPEFIGFAQAGPAVNEAFVSGAIDASVYGDLPAVVLKSKGIDISVVGINDAQSNLSIAVAEDSEISVPKDLEGKKVLVSIGTVIEQYWGRVVEEYGIDPGKVEIVNDPANALQTFIAGNADAFVSVDIYVAVAGAQKPIKVIDSTKASHPEWGYQGVVGARNEFAKEHPEVITAFLKAYLRGYDDVVADPTLSVQSNVIEGSVSQELAQSLYGDIDISVYDGDIADENITKLAELNDFLFNNQLTSVSVDINSLIDTSYYEAAKAALGK